MKLRGEQAPNKNDLLNNRLRFSSTKKLTTILQPPPLMSIFTDKERIDFILTAVENVCFKLERCMDNQNQKIRNIETRLSDTLVQKLDKLLESNLAIARALQRQHLKNNLQIKPSQFFEKHHMRGVSDQYGVNAVNEVNEVQQARQIEQQPDPKCQQSHMPSLRSLSLQKAEIQANLCIPVDEPIVPSTITIQQIPLNSIVLPTLKQIDSPTLPKLKSRLPTIVIVDDAHQRQRTEQVIHPHRVEQTTTIIISKPVFDREAFMVTLMKKMRDFHNAIAERLYNEYSQGKLDYKDMKIQYSWSVMNFYFDMNNQIIRGPSELLETLGSRMSLSKTIDETTRNILEFLIKKYPPSRNKIVDTELANHIKQITRQSDLTYDILRNAGISFADDTGKREFTKEIKGWLNMLISHTKVMYPEFKKIIKRIFTDGDRSLISVDEEHQIQYEIHSKISQNTPSYTDQEQDMPGLNLKSPQLLRILVKWAEELLDYFLKSEQKIIQNKSGFKSTTSGRSISLTLKRKQNLARTLREIYKQDILPRTTNRQRHMYNMMNELFTMAFEGYKGYEYLAERELLIAKISQYFSECASTYTEKMLNNMIAGLNKLRIKYKDELLESSVDLVTFGVMDLMRCKCVGSRPQIMRIYGQLVEEKKFQLIRVKNKLNESTRDILINFKHRDSFLICQMQLALGDTKDDVNDHFCHNLYEMRRSAFPVLFENANQLVNLDPRARYFDSSKSIQFRPNPQFQPSKNTIVVKDCRVFCIKSHEQQQMIFHSNSAPFCCSYCSRFVNSHTYSIEYLRCYRCMACICPKCLLERCGDFETTYRNRHQKVTDLSEFMKKEPYYMGFCQNSELQVKIIEALNQECNRVLVNQFDRQGLKTNVYKLCDGRPVTAFCTIDKEKICAQSVSDSSNNWNIIWIPLKIGIFKLIDLKLYKKQSYFKDYPEHVLEKYLSEEKVICALEEESKSALIMDIQEEKDQIERELVKVEMIKHIKKQNKKTELNLELTTKDLKDLSILKLVTRKSQVKSLNLWENDLTNISELRDFVGIQDLNLRENKISSIRQVLYMTNLQYLDIHKNNLSGKLPKFDLPNLRTLDLSVNKLKDLSSLSDSSLPALSVFFISHNELSELPVLVCLTLEVYFFSHNRIHNLQNLYLSRLPKLRRLYGFSNVISGQLPDLNFPCLEYMLLEDNQIEGIDILSKWKINSLQTISLNNNRISGDLPVLNLKGLRKLDLNQNRISSISGLQRSSLPNIGEIDLSNNSIQGSLPTLPFSSLQKLTLSFNKLNSIESLESPKTELKKLNTLILSNNSLEQLPILRLLSLRFIDLSNNSITSIDIMSEWTLPQIQIVQLQSNSIKGDVPLLFLSNLLELHLDGNDISQIRCLNQKQLIPKLKIISIKNNKSKEIGDGTLEVHKQRPLQRALSGIWRSKIRPAEYADD